MNWYLCLQVYGAGVLGMALLTFVISIRSRCRTGESIDYAICNGVIWPAFLFLVIKEVLAPVCHRIDKWRGVE